MSELTVFLEARLAEDADVARAAIDPERPGTHWQWVRSDDDVVVEAPTWEEGDLSLRSVEEFPTASGIGDLPAFVLNHVEADEPRAFPHIARHDPARVLVEVEAKRAIVALHSAYEFPQVMTYGTIIACNECGSVDDSPQEWPCPTLRLLASVYRGHEDYQEGWAL